MYATLVRPVGPGPFPAVVKEITFLFPENANHVLKEELRPRLELVPVEITESYNGPATRLDQETLASILRWLAAYT